MSTAIYLLMAGLGATLLAGAAMVRYLLRRLARLELRKENDDQKVREERDELRRRVADHAEKLKTQSLELASLRAQVTTQSETIQALLLRVDGTERENTRLRDEARRREKELCDSEARAAELEGTNRGLRQALILLGARLQDEESPPPETVSAPKDSGPGDSEHGE